MQGLHSTARAVLTWQLVLACLAAALFLFGGRDAALASLAGSAIAIVPTVLTYLRTRQALVGVGARDPRQYVQMLGRAQAAKFGLTTLMFALVMSRWAEQFFAIMAGFAAGLVAYWIVMWRAKHESLTGIYQKHGE